MQRKKVQVLGCGAPYEHGSRKYHVRSALPVRVKHRGHGDGDVEVMLMAMMIILYSVVAKYMTSLKL